MNKRIKKKILSRHGFPSIMSYKKFKKELDKAKRPMEHINYEYTEQFLRECSEMYTHSLEYQMLEMLRTKENENNG